MAFPERLSNLPDYAFPRLRALLDAHAPGATPIAMSIGEPKHAFPDFVGETLMAHLGGLSSYPANEGTPELLSAIAGWVQRRYGVSLGPERLMALNGTREGLFNACLALCPERKGGGRPVVLIDYAAKVGSLAGELGAGGALLPWDAGALAELPAALARVVDHGEEVLAARERLVARQSENRALLHRLLEVAGG